MRSLYIVTSLLIGILISGCQMTPTKLPEGVTPVAATWLYGRYTLPRDVTIKGASQTYQQTAGEPTWTDLAGSTVRPGNKVPVVLYMHGCKGFSRQGERFRDLMTSEGYAFFAPDSFQRPGRRQCGKQGRLQERVSLRKEEVQYAFEQIRNLSWVDQSRVILMGFSEGGNTTDNWSEPGFAAHIIMGSACTLVGGSPAAPLGIPVLAVVGSNDEYRPGKSCDIERTVGGSQSIVLPGVRHSVAQYPETQKAIRHFLKRCCA